MERGLQGTYVRSIGQPEPFSAFVPRPLPPEPPLTLDAELQDLLERANRAIGRLDGLALMLPDRPLFLYLYVRKEAVLSSQIEGTQSSLSDLLANCARTGCQRYRLPEETVQLKLEPVEVRAPQADLEIVFRNLLDNALKYSGDQPQIEVETHRNDHGRVVTRISDNGPGIPVSLRRKIFGRFVRLGNELERKTSGTGLGLYIVRTLVRRMGGKIQVHGRSGKTGTVFEVDLPAAAA